MNTITDKKEMKIERLERRADRIASIVHAYKKRQSVRLDETKKIFSDNVLAVDIHSHSTFSDGAGSVEDNYEIAMMRGLDFLFATDHRSLSQKEICDKLQNASWGQEPSDGLHHIGMLHPSELFSPEGKNIAEDFAKAEKLAPFAWIPHPAGWFPQRKYTDEQIESLWTLPDCFSMEIMNAAGRLYRAYDEFDMEAISTWDKLLCDGKKITAVGGSDAHCPESVGAVWTGVYAKKCNAESIIDSLRKGECFASEASLLSLTGDNNPMGSTLQKKCGSIIELQYRVADVAGIRSIRVISQGEIIKEIDGQSKDLVTGTISQKIKHNQSYFRLESTADDDSRAFSTPIYIS